MARPEHMLDLCSHSTSPNKCKKEIELAHWIPGQDHTSKLDQIRCMTSALIASDTIGKPTPHSAVSPVSV